MALKILLALGALEFLDALPDGRPDFGNAFGPEEEDEDQEENRDFGEAEIAEHEFLF